MGLRTPKQGTTRITLTRDSVKRNLNKSFGESPEKKQKSPIKSPRTSSTTRRSSRKSLILVINKKDYTCRSKEALIESDSESVSPDHGKRKIKTPSRYTSFDTPVKPLRHNFELMATPKNKLLTKEGLTEIKTPRTPKLSTPRNTMRLIREGVITPSVPSRSKALQNPGTPLSQARSQLHVSYLPKTLPCRDKEYSDVLNFLTGKLLDKCGGCMYISGVPGTGKTATVTSVINYLLKEAKNGDVPEFEFVGINGMKLTEPRQAYVEILKQLTGKTVHWEQAQGILNDRFTKKSKKTQLPIVLLVDELDIICNRRQDVVYNLLDWPTKANAQLIIITIANTMDLPERLLMSRVTSRLGLTRLPFQAYTHKQLQEIVMKRLAGTNSFNPDAVQLVARKVASVSGDARRALDICRRAAEIAEAEGEDTLVTMGHVNEALKAMITQPKVRAVKCCSKLEQLCLQAVIAEVERTGIEETVFNDVYRMLLSLLTLNGLKAVSCTVVLSAISRLGSCRLLLIDQKCNDLNQKIILNVSADDVYYALKEE